MSENVKQKRNRTGISDRCVKRVSREKEKGKKKPRTQRETEAGTVRGTRLRATSRTSVSMVRLLLLESCGLIPSEAFW